MKRPLKKAGIGRLDGEIVKKLMQRYYLGNMKAGGLQ